LPLGGIIALLQFPFNNHQRRETRPLSLIISRNEFLPNARALTARMWIGGTAGGHDFLTSCASFAKTSKTIRRRCQRRRTFLREDFTSRAAVARVPRKGEGEVSRRICERDQERRRTDDARVRERENWDEPASKEKLP